VTERTEPLDALVEDVRRGDREAIAKVYLEVGPGLRGFLRRRVAHGEVADDLVEQTFVELIEGAERFRGDGRALRAWLYRAARNNLRDWAKRADRRSDHPLPDGDTSRSAAGNRDASDDALDDMYDHRLEAALGRLTEEQREVVELRLVAELSLAQVAELTGRSIGAVKLLQYRAVRGLARSLTTKDEEGLPPNRP
jgi:RNA polymerase sigma-70 factor, ECF subfamily